MEPALALLGHNRAPLTETLAEDHAAIIARAADIVAAAARLPESVDDDTTAGKVGDFMRQITACTKALETARVAAKAPHLEAGRAVDGFFTGHTTPLAQVRASAQKLLDAFAQRKRAAEMAARQEAAKKAAEEAERQAAAARTEADLNRAIEREAEAKKAAAAVAAKPAEMIRTRGELGGLVTGRTTWAHEIEDIHAIPLETLRPYLTPDAIDAAVRKFVAAGGRSLAGVRVFERTISIVR